MTKLSGSNQNIMNCESCIKNIISSWFYSEPLLFAAVTTHQIIENKNITMPMRTGKMRIEYNPVLLEDNTQNQLENYLKIEVYRILFQHPYTRLPHNVKKGVMYIASDLTLYQQDSSLFTKSELHFPTLEYLKNQAVRFHILTHPLGIKWADSDELKFFQRNLFINHKTGNLQLCDDLSFEQWYRKILFLVTETAIASTEGAGKKENKNNINFSFPNDEEAAELWEENQEAQSIIQNEIKRAEREQGWGGIGGSLQRSIKEGTDFSFDYRKALTQFRASILSANRTLTRMKPSRRYGFKAMGSRYERKANILIAVDVSGSITDESFEHFYRAIKNIFFLGIIEKIDVIFFDVNLKNTTPISFRKKINLEQIKGRGGTSFQPAIDYFETHQKYYSGLIIFTDGEGNVPVLNNSTHNILWILDSHLAYEKSHSWITSLKGCKATYLPF